MKLKNKKTGEMCELKVTVNGDLTITKDDEIIGIYSSLAELNEEWEDAPEEPKEYWYIDYGGRIKAINDANDEEDLARKEIGNYFETKEEAEKAVEKLKAWKRLKDKGFKFDDKLVYGDYYGCGSVRFIIYPAKRYKDVIDDLTLIFGGEE